MLTEPKGARVALCQYCRAEIEWNVQKCRHCGEWVGEPPVASSGAARASAQVHAVASMSSGKLGWFSTAALAGGVFLPFLSIPMLGGVSLWHLGYDGVLVLGLAAFAMAAHWQQWRRPMLAATVPAAGIVGYDFVRALAELGGAMGGLVSFGPGAFVLVIAGILAVVAAWTMD